MNDCLNAGKKENKYYKLYEIITTTTKHLNLNILFSLLFFVNKLNMCHC